jgi:hypothetical protein
MQILKMGNKPEKKEFLGYTIECLKCGCVYEVQRNEVNEGFTQGGLYRYWNCPCCRAYQEDGQGGCDSTKIIESRFL